jgi:hypothetical protein
MIFAIREAAMAADVTEAAALFGEYAEALGVDLGFQGFEQEQAKLPGALGPGVIR